MQRPTRTEGEDQPTVILALVGSLRTASVNMMFARAVMADPPPGVEIRIHPLDDLPLYNGDLEHDRRPAGVDALNTAVASADALVFFSPEYNTSLPAVTKNAIDWLSREPKAWTDKVTTIVSASPGSRAGIGARDHFASIMSWMTASFTGETLGLGHYADRFDPEDDAVVAPATVVELQQFLARVSDLAAQGVQE